MIAFVSKKEQLEHVLSEHNDEISDSQRKEYTRELMGLQGRQCVDVDMWNQYEEKYSIKNRQTHSQMVRT